MVLTRGDDKHVSLYAEPEMSENDDFDPQSIRDNLEMILEHFEALKQADAVVAFYNLIAEKLSRVIHKDPPWTWRYVQGVHKGTIEPSRVFGRAVMLLGLAIDEVPLLIVDTEAVQVYAKPGDVKAGSIVMTPSVVCANPACNIQFVPNVPWRKLCPVCSPPKG
jgi:hypothetical protein